MSPNAQHLKNEPITHREPRNSAGERNPQPPVKATSPEAPNNRAHKDTLEMDGEDPEKNPLPSKAGLLSRARIIGPVTKEYGDWPLLAMSLVTGMVDGACFTNYGMFIGMQTGNTVILGLSTAGLPDNPHAWLTTLVSIVTFLVGAFLTFRVSKVITPDGPNRNRLWEASLFMIQALFLILAAALATPDGLIPQNPGGTARNTPNPPEVIENIEIVSLIPPLAFQSGIQIATSRLLGFNELPINVITSTYCDLMGDFKLLATNNVKRNRRALSVVLLLIGAIASGWLMRSEGGLEGILWISAGIKFLTAVAVFCFTPAIKDEIPK
ncbi:hypothetical protein D0861_04058 [Hortaea werneckii]|uniref:DUF1275 domain protein n=1 Tax=Hortaea werneckii TaxID=91943 RepID=A0A3M7FLH0_HORWE|nr:hypothetical protein D0861_04058 [Hortaea werneckii]